MGFENSGLIAIRNNTKLRGFYRRPKLLNTKLNKSDVHMPKGKATLNSESLLQAKRNRMREVISFISVMVIALILALYLLDSMLSIF